MALVDPFANLHILIIDDQELHLDIIEAMLLKIGVAKVIRAKSGADAIAAIKTAARAVDCTICDYRMENGNGLEFLKYVRMGQAKSLRADACIILLTASTDVGIIQTAGELDANAYLVKPVTPDKLKAAIERARSRYFPINFDKYSRVILPVG